MDQGKKAASLTTTRLSPLAKPFTLNRSTHQPSSSSSVLHCNDDPFSSLLDSFRKSNLGSKVETVPVEAALPVETSTQKQEKSSFEQYPSAEISTNGDFDGFTWSHFETLDEFTTPTYSSSLTSLGYGTGTNGSEVSYRKQGVDFHESLFGKGSDVGISVDDGSMLQKGKHALDGSTTCVAVSDGLFKKCTDTIGEKDILSNSKGTIDESSSFLKYPKVAPLKLSTDASSAKNIPQNESSKNLGADSDSDVDSPCWKGTTAFSLTPSETSGPVQSHHVENAIEKHNSLNPLAPQFFPGIGYIKDDFASSKSSAYPVATNLLSGKDLLMKTVVAESPVESHKGIEVQHYSDIYGREKTFRILNDPKSNFVDPVQNSHCMMTQSSSKVDCSTSKGKLVTAVDVDGFVKGTKDQRASGSDSGVFHANGHFPIPSSSSSGADVDTDLLKTLRGLSKSFIESPKPDVHIMVNAMHVLSELLVQTCVDRADSYNEPDCDIVVQIINNLNVFSTKRIEQRIPTLDSTQADSPYCVDRSSKLTEGLELTSIETLPTPDRLFVHNDYMGKNSVSKVFAESGQISFAPSSHQGTDKANEFAQLQVIRRSLGKSLDFEKQMHPEALLFWNLWLDSEAERCYRKFKTFHCLMEAGMDLNSGNVAELLR